jgi:hypothetical protein
LPAPHDFSYPSIGAAAVLSDIIKLPDFMSYLKASINYAEVGNGGRFGLLNPVYNYSQGAGNGFLQRGSTLPIPGLKPEIVKNTEGSIEADFSIIALALWRLTIRVIHLTSYSRYPCR